MLQDILATFSLTVIATVLMAGMVRGFSGFGFSLAAVPLLSLALPLNTVVPLALGLEAIGVLPALSRIWRQAHWRIVGFLLLGSVLAMPLGLYILHVGTPWLLRPAMALLVLAAVILIWHPPEPAPTGSNIAPGVFAGAVSGILNGAAAMSGPPIILYMLSSQRRPDVGRATMMLFFSASATITLTAGLASGTYAFPDIGLFLWCLPFLVIGVEAGTWLRNFASPARARRIALLVLATSALVSVSVSLASLF